jgi:hypothetical protein
MSGDKEGRRGRHLKHWIYSDQRGRTDERMLRLRCEKVSEKYYEWSTDSG